jgi:hypothetical protein
MARSHSRRLSVVGAGHARDYRIGASPQLWERAMPATPRSLPVSLHLAETHAAFAAFARIRPFRSNAPEYTCVGASSFTVTSPFTST